ncbi:hypothetical protein B8W72_26105 [Pseudomonas putida]|uniref:Uncharacterized protein n=1 Tax=Pseudomonas putida TaxID=303 RepID=A0A1Y3KG34_PSEPU|nr:hypothetical protein B8W72_26105 [Pseudomonas putida]
MVVLFAENRAMFETHDQAELPSFFQLDEGARSWGYIAQTSNQEWFYVTHETSDTETRWLQQFMIPLPQFVLEFASRDAPEAFIREIQLVSPPWLNERGSWLMEPIRAIHKVGERFCYELADGHIYPVELAGLARQTLWSKDG